MKTRRFAGGVHPHDDQKPRTKSCPIETLSAPTKVVIPLSQHIGAPAVACVAKGDVVKRGQKIADAGGFVSVPYHASISGKVTLIDKVRHVLGHFVDAVTIESDGLDEAIDGYGELTTDYNELDSKEIIERISSAGLCGMGGAGFPVHVKLSPPEDKKIDYIILNGAECEPALSADHQVMLSQAEKMLKGLKYVKCALTKDGHAPEILIGIENNKPDAAQVVEKCAEELGIECEVALLEVWYPQGAEKQLIFALTGREVPPASERGLPMDVGCVVQNAGTAVAVCDAVERKMPLTERVMTLAGSGIGKPANISARIGTPLEVILEGREVAENVARVIAGGPMMGLAQYDTEIYLTKTTSGILLETEKPTEEFGPCIRCGRCVTVCPMKLVPSKLSVLSEAGLFEAMENWNNIDCIECGCCAYTCPAGRPIVQQIKLGKWMKQQADRARAKQKDNTTAKSKGGE